ncbi:TetR/AcrR family transcriptional regulator [Falsirhodobacter sp. 1013]|uniref:TetR/AcrR family transcriptional regulator n=1 Tax=Falsirhodobacter sp. 1013 TaxID=3417566 RepID=UPI003EB6FDD2
MLRKIPQQARSKQLVEDVIEAAARILETSGAEALTTNMITEVAGVSPGSVYQYFSDKPSIIRALIEREANEFMEVSENALRGLTGVEAMIAFAKALTLHRLQRPKLTLQLILMDPTLTTSPESAEINTRIHDLLMDVVRQASILTDEDASVAVMDMMGIMRGMMLSDFMSHCKHGGLPDRIADAVTGYWRLRVQAAAKSE